MTSYLFSFNPPKIWAWKSHAGFGKFSFNPMQKERDFIQHQLQKTYTYDLLACPMRICYDLYFEIPASYSKKKRQAILNKEILHTNPPDCTNVQKFLEDCLKGVIIEDDKYVVESTTRKHYSTRCQINIKIDLLS